MIAVKPAATSDCSLLWVLAQPAARASRAMALRILNEVGICFMVFCMLVLFSCQIGRSRSRFIEAHGGRDEEAIGKRRPCGGEAIGSEPRLNNVAEPARIKCGPGVVGVFVDREKDETSRPLRAPQLARRFDDVEPRHGDVEYDDIRMEALRLSEEFASIARSTDH